MLSLDRTPPCRRATSTKSAILIACVALCVSSQAQYRDYPRNEGQVETFRLSDQRWWLADVEVRGRSENQTAMNFVSGHNQAYELTRIRGGISVRPASWITGYLQFHDTHARALPLASTAANMRDSFDLRQGYVDLHYRFVQLVVGRQELKIGDERVVGVSDWANNGRSWDGIDAKVGKDNRLELFSTSVVAVHATSLDTHGAGLTFHGATAQLTKVLPQTTLAPFVLLRRLPHVLSQQGVYGAENEVTTGLYAASTLPAGFEYTATGTLQRGSYSDDSIHSGSGIVKAGYTANHLPWKPRLLGEYDYATGNPHRNPLRIGTNDQVYPTNHNSLGLVDLFGFANIKQMRAHLEMKPTPNLSVLFQVGSLHLTTTRDNAYTGSGGTLIKAPAAGFKADGIGTEFDVSAKYIFHKYLVSTAGVGHLFPGAVLTQNAHGAPLTLAYFSVKYRFTLQ